MLLAVAAYGGLKLWRIYQDRKTPDFQPPMAFVEVDFPVEEFELTERSGQPFRSKDMLGQVWLASFFYGDCPFQCTILNHRIADLLAGELADDPVKLVSITVDPKKDTPQRLSSYAKTFIQQKIDPQRWLFVTHAQGSEQAIGAICQGSFRVAYARAAHSEKLVLVDQQGIVRGYFNPADALDVKRLKRKIHDLRQQPPEGDVDKKKGSEKEA